jgi:hypothetical protein
LLIPNMPTLPGLQSGRKRLSILTRASFGEASARLAETPADLGLRPAAVAARHGLPPRQAYARAPTLAGARR